MWITSFESVEKNPCQIGVAPTFDHFKIFFKNPPLPPLWGDMVSNF